MVIRPTIGTCILSKEAIEVQLTLEWTHLALWKESVERTRGFRLMFSFGRPSVGCQLALLPGQKSGFELPWFSNDKGSPVRLPGNDVLQAFFVSCFQHIKETNRKWGLNSSSGSLSLGLGRLDYLENRVAAHESKIAIKRWTLTLSRRWPFVSIPPLIWLNCSTAMQTDLRWCPWSHGDLKAWCRKRVRCW